MNNFNEENLANVIEKMTQEINVAKGELGILEKSKEDYLNRLKEIDHKTEVLDQVQTVLRKAAEFARNQAKSNIEKMVTSFLQFIFESNIEFSIELTTQRDASAAEFYVISTYNGYSVKTKPENSRGGGVVDIISLALRLAFLQLKDPQLDGPLILDEPGKHVSEDYIFNLGEFIKINADHYKRQIIMVTHNKHLTEFGDRCLYVEANNGISLVKELSAPQVN
ncbi:ATPase [Peptoniphilus sp. GNH]|nr:hypothetical protein HMPREF3189_00131 [Clostridiales bacterium KA00134]UHR03094.1 ATPase [Peptoniphilus sp. GNH]